MLGCDPETIGKGWVFVDGQGARLNPSDDTFMRTRMASCLGGKVPELVLVDRLRKPVDYLPVEKWDKPFKHVPVPEFDGPLGDHLRVRAYLGAPAVGGAQTDRSPVYMTILRGQDGNAAPRRDGGEVVALPGDVMELLSQVATAANVAHYHLGWADAVRRGDVLPYHESTEGGERKVEELMPVPTCTIAQYTEALRGVAPEVHAPINQFVPRIAG